jgi:hypothetical protein
MFCANNRLLSEASPFAEMSYGMLSVINGNLYLTVLHDIHRARLVALIKKDRTLGDY